MRAATPRGRSAFWSRAEEATLYTGDVDEVVKIGLLAQQIVAASPDGIDRTSADVLIGIGLQMAGRFDEATPLLEKALAAGATSGETARKRDASSMDELTPQELQVARMVADGLSNKDVAAQLFLSPRTIDAHLRNMFSKLGITSRTQLARLPLGDGGEAPAHPAAAPA